MAHFYRVEHFQPTSDPPQSPSSAWKEEFQFHVYNEEKEVGKSVLRRMVSIPGNPTAHQQAAIDALAAIEEVKVRKFLSCLGSETLRQFKTKVGTAWGHTQIANKTLAQAKDIGDQLFGDLRHHLTSLTDLYAARRKSTETTEQFLTRLRHSARVCKLRDHEKTDMRAENVHSGEEADSSEDEDGDLDDLLALVTKSKRGTGSNRNYRVSRSKDAGGGSKDAQPGRGGSKVGGSTKTVKGLVCGKYMGVKGDAINGGQGRAIGKKCLECGGSDYCRQRPKSKAMSSSQAPLALPAGVNAEETRILLSVDLRLGPNQPQKQVKFLADTEAQITTLTNKQEKQSFPDVKLLKSKKNLSGFKVLGPAPLTPW